MRCAPAHTRGFTLIEMLVAIALLSVLVASVYTFTVTLFDREARTLDEAAKSQVATMLFDRLEADLMTAVAVSGRGAGLRGDAESLTITQRSVMPGSQQAPDSDRQTTTISYDAARMAVTIVRTDGDTAPPRESEAYPVVVRHAQFRYHDGSDWSTRFTSNRGLPVAVELAIWFGDQDDLPEPDETLADETGGIGGIPGEDTLGQPYDPRTESGAPAGLDEMMGEDPFADPFAIDPLAEDSLADLPAPDRVRVITIPDARVPRSVRLSNGGGS